jgi:hypothetical protein
MGSSKKKKNKKTKNERQELRNKKQKVSEVLWQRRNQQKASQLRSRQRWAAKRGGCEQ